MDTKTAQELALEQLGIGNVSGTNTDKTNPEVTNPDETNPEETNPDETNPDETNPDETNPDETNGITDEQINSFIASKYPNRFNTLSDIDNYLLEKEKELTEYDNLKKEMGKFNKIKSHFEDSNILKTHLLSKKTGIDDLNFINKVIKSDFDKMTALEVLTIKEKIDNPELSDADIKELLEEKYDLQKPDDYEDLEDFEQEKIDKKIRIKTANLNKQAKAVKEELNNLKNSIDIPDFETVSETKLNSIVEGWKPKFSELSKASKDIRVKVTVNGVNKEIVIKPKDIDEQYRKVVEDAGRVIINNLVELNEENGNFLPEYINQSLLIQNKELVFSEIAKQSYDAGVKSVQQKIYNTDKKGTNIPAGNNGKLTDQQKAMLALGIK